MEYNQKIKRRFNTTGLCNPKFHYMLNLDERLLSFNFNKSKEISVKKIRIGNKTLVEAIV